MPNWFRAQVSLRHDSGLPEDASVNTFHFNDPTALLDPQDIVTLLDDFYSAVHGGVQPFDGFLAACLTGTADVNIYRLQDPSPRVPVITDTFTFAPDNQVPLPSEVAVCLSFQGVPLAGVNQARRRGRIYIGPLSVLSLEGVNAGDTTGPSPARVAPTLITRIMAAADQLGSDSTAAGFEWSVYSPTANTMTEIDNGWVDNAFDIQRRRGETATSRTTQSF